MSISADVASQKCFVRCLCGAHCGGCCCWCCWTRIIVMVAVFLNCLWTTVNILSSWQARGAAHWPRGAWKSLPSIAFFFPIVAKKRDSVNCQVMLLTASVWALPGNLLILTFFYPLLSHFKYKFTNKTNNPPLEPWFTVFGAGYRGSTHVSWEVLRVTGIIFWRKISIKCKKQIWVHLSKTAFNSKKIGGRSTWHGSPRKEIVHFP